jgi:hypothetical protein
MERWYCRINTQLLAHGHTLVLVKLEKTRVVSHEFASLWSLANAYWSRSLSEERGSPNHICLGLGNVSASAALLLQQLIHHYKRCRNRQ